MVPEVTEEETFKAALRAALEAEENGALRIAYDRVHRVLAEGNFVLCMSEGRKAGLGRQPERGHVRLDRGRRLEGRLAHATDAAGHEQRGEGSETPGRQIANTWPT